MSNPTHTNGSVNVARPKSKRRRPEAWALLLVGLIVAGITWFVYPHGSGDLSAFSTIRSIDVVSPIDGDVTFEMRPDGAGGTHVSFTDFGTVLPSVQTTVLLSLTVPANTWGSQKACSHVDGAGCAGAGNGLKYFQFSLKPVEDNGDEYVAKASFSIPAVRPTYGFVAAHNTTHAAAWLPPTDLFMSTTQNTIDQQTVIFDYAIANADAYEWNVGPPSFTDGKLAEWSSTVSQKYDNYLPSVYASGVNVQSADDANTRTFFAGALLGLAGGLLASAFAVFVTPRSEDASHRPRGHAG
jgi:hypothetical protein